MEAIILYPSPPIGHLISMVELGKLILTQKPSLSIHILITETTPTATQYISQVSNTISSITFHHLPPLSPPSTVANHHETLTFQLLNLSNPNIHNTLVSITKNHTIISLIADFFCYSVISVTSSLNIPIYFFFASGAGSLAAFLYFPTLHENTTQSFKDMDQHEPLNIPGRPCTYPKDMPKPILSRDDEVYHYMLESAKTSPKSAGIIVNTFDCLESRTIKAITDGVCVPNASTPPIYSIGPLIAAKDGGKSDCLTWLDSQPSQSVIFLCFGSRGLFSLDQLREIAVGLERSGQRFLWVVRDPKSEKLGQVDMDLESILPAGFMDRTKERGLVVKNWAPQMEVLSHDSVGGFVTHCGWNSVLEAVYYGVPMVAWPLYAEQRLNKILMVDTGIGLGIAESENGWVSWREVEKPVRDLMQSKEGDAVRKRTMELRNEAKAALMEGGSSRLALVKLLKSWNRED